MPGRGKPPRGRGHARAGRHDGGVGIVGLGEPNRVGHGRSQWSPAHMKREAGEGSARDFAPGRGGTPPGQMGRDGRENAVEAPKAASLEREA